MYSVAYTPDGRTLLTGGKDRTIKRINVRTLKEERTYSGHDEDVFAVAVHPDGKRFVSAGNEPQLRWWNLDGDKPSARRGGSFGAGPAARVQRRRPAADLGRRRSVRPALGRHDRGADPPACRPGRVAIRRRDLGRRQAGGGGGLGRPGPALGRRLGPPARDARPAAGRGRQPGQPRTPAPEWLAVTPGGQVAGSPELLQMARWRAGGVTLARRGRASGLRLSRGRSREPCAEKPSRPSRSRPRRGSEP